MRITKVLGTLFYNNVKGAVWQTHKYLVFSAFIFINFLFLRKSCNMVQASLKPMPVPEC